MSEVVELPPRIPSDNSREKKLRHISKLLWELVKAYFRTRIFMNFWHSRRQNSIQTQHPEISFKAPALCWSKFRNREMNRIRNRAIFCTYTSAEKRFTTPFNGDFLIKKPFLGQEVPRRRNLRLSCPPRFSISLKCISSLETWTFYVSDFKGNNIRCARLSLVFVLKTLSEILSRLGSE